MESCIFRVSGVTLSKGRNAFAVEYAPRDTSKPMGVAEYRLTPAPSLPAKLHQPLEAQSSRHKKGKIRRAAETALHCTIGLAINSRNRHGSIWARDTHGNWHSSFHSLARR
jgi:hypothetical protein